MASTQQSSDDIDEYSNAFRNYCHHFFVNIRENQPFSKCLDILRSAALQYKKDTTKPKIKTPHQTSELFETIWFIYYMFFAIHNPKLEEYITKKQVTSLDYQDPQQELIAIAHILKNMEK
jgi:hypothetical protein